MQNLMDVMSLDQVISNPPPASTNPPPVSANPPPVSANLPSASANVSDHTSPYTPAFTAATPSPDVAAIAYVRLPGFWRHSPQQWFIHAEAIFQTNRVRSDLTKVNHVLSALDEDGIRTIADLLGADIQYSLVRHRLINAYSIPQATRFRTIVQPGGLGDRRPSQMLRDMRSVLPDGINDSALKEFWLQKLPQHILMVVSGLDGSLESLAERADRVVPATMFPRLEYMIAVVISVPSRMHY